MRMSRIRAAVVAVAAVAASLSVAAPAMAAPAVAAEQSGPVQIAASWQRWGNFSDLGACISAGQVGKANGHWLDWRCTYPPVGFDLYVYR